MVADFSLFPCFDQWGTGDEAMDTKLSSALKKVKEDLTFKAISEFWFYGLSLRPRAHNPAFHTTIEFVTKAFLFCLYPDEYNDLLMKKIKGDYANKRREVFLLPEASLIMSELKKNKIYRYKGQIDFYLNAQGPEEKNPFVRQTLKRSPEELHAKIIMKDFKSFLLGEKESSAFIDSLFQSLRLGQKVLLIDNFAEIWYHEDQIYCLPLI